MTNERPQLTKSQAINNQWVIAYHRLTYAKEHNRPCRCEDCSGKITNETKFSSSDRAGKASGVGHMGTHTFRKLLKNWLLR